MIAERLPSLSVRKEYSWRIRSGCGMRKGGVSGEIHKVDCEREEGAKFIIDIIALLLNFIFDFVIGLCVMCSKCSGRGRLKGSEHMEFCG